MDIEQLSVELENETMCDSIPTIARVYDGECCFPDCKFKTRDPERMWKHVHFGRHGLHFGMRLPELIAKREVEVVS